MSMVDFIKTDQRDNIRPNPFWARSIRMNWDGVPGFNNVMDDNEAVFMSFPLGGKGAFPIVVHGVVIEIIEAFDGTPALLIGDGTIPTFLSSHGDTVTPVTDDSVAAEAVVISATPGIKQTIVLAADLVLIPADVNTPVLYITLTAAGAVTQGAIRVTPLVSEAS